jgi:hypothetical protein
LRACPQVKKYLWGGEFWADEYFITTVGAHGNEQMIKNYVQQQGKFTGRSTQLILIPRCLQRGSSFSVTA